MVVYNKERERERKRKILRRPARRRGYIALESEVALAGDPAVPVAYTPFLLKRT